MVTLGLQEATFSPAHLPRTTGTLPRSAEVQGRQLLFHNVEESIHNTTFTCLAINTMGTGQWNLTILLKGEELGGGSATTATAGGAAAGPPAGGGQGVCPTSDPNVTPAPRPSPVRRGLCFLLTRHLYHQCHASASWIHSLHQPRLGQLWDASFLRAQKRPFLGS